MKEQHSTNISRRPGFRRLASFLRAARLVVLLALLLMFPANNTIAAVTHPQYDIQGDRFADLAAGVLHEDLDGIFDAGALNIFYGRQTPFTFYDTYRQFWHQKKTDIRDIAEEGDKFASSLASGDFNGDFLDDLAVGVPLEDIQLNFDVFMDAGAVNVLYGTGEGLSDVDDEFWIQEYTAGYTDANEYFGSALASGDFDNDGYEDLAVGTPGEKVDGQDQAGAVDVLYGTADGLSSDGAQNWHQNRAGMQDGAQAHDQFGTALASGDFNKDGYDDLVIGVPFEDIGDEPPGIEDAGAVNILYGSCDGLTSAGSQFLHQDTPGILDGAEADDRFGWSLAAGKLNGDSYDDLAVGILYESIGEANQAGAVSVLFGYDYGITTFDQFWHQDEADIKDEAEDYDRFGWSLAIGDFDNSGIGDLVIGVPMEDLDGKDDAGAIHVIYSIITGPHPNDNQLWHQDIGSVVGEVNGGDRFGHALAVGDFDGDGYVDLVVGVPGEEVNNKTHAGWVNVLLGSYSGITDFNDSKLHQDISGIYDDSPEQADNFGSSLAVLHPHPYRIYLPLIMQALQ